MYLYILAPSGEWVWSTLVFTGFISLGISCALKGREGGEGGREGGREGEGGCGKVVKYIK